MDVLNLSAEQLVDQALRFSAITGLTRSSAEDRFFLVMGKTGSGKSTFIARCTGQDVTVGHGLYSCTSAIDTYSYPLPTSKPDGRLRTRRIHLIDTPGFNDTNRSDIETLAVLASYLGASYANGIQIHGIIFLHPITDNRMSGSSMRTMEMMKMTCGWTSYENMAIVTTMWPDKSSAPSNALWGQRLRVDSQTTLETREVELITDERFLGDVVDYGAMTFRHNETGSKDLNAQILSARRIVAHLVAKSDSPTYVQKPLRIQREIIDEGKTLGELVAGTAIADELDRTRRDHERQLRELETEMRTQLTKADECHTAQLQDLKTEILQKIAKAEDEKKALRKTMSDLHDEERQAWMQKINELDKAFQAKITEKEEELEDLKQSIHEIRQDTYTSSLSSDDEEELYAHEEIVHNASQEIDDAKSNRDRLKRVAGNIVNGLANGVGAAVTTSVVGALAGTLLCAVM